MRRLLANVFLWISDKLDRRRTAVLARLNERAQVLERRVQVLEKQNGELILRYFNDETNPRFDVDADWTPDDAAAFRGFLGSQLGQAFQKRLGAVSVQVAISGCQDVMHTAHSAGAAYGWNEAYNYIIKLSRVSRVPDTKTEEAPEGEEQLLERLSP